MLETARKNGKDRAKVAKEIGDALGRDVSPAMLAEFTRIPIQPREQNGEKPRMRKRYLSLPTPWVRALSAATRSDKLTRYLMDAPNLEVLDLGERQHLKFDWAIDRLERLYSRIQNLKARQPRKQRRKRGVGKA